MEKGLKTFVKIATVVGVIFFAQYFLPILLGGYALVKGIGLAFRIGNRIRERRAARLGQDVQMARLNKKLHKKKVSKRFFDEQNNCWIVNERTFPLDMVPDNVNGRMTRFTCSGVKDPEEGYGIVGARYCGKNLFGRQKVEFTLTLDSADKAVLIDKYIKKNGIVGCYVESSVGEIYDDSGIVKNEKKLDTRAVYHVRSDNPEDINELVKQFYPASTMNVEREVITTRQYLVSGCTSYEQAVEKAEKMIADGAFSYNTCVQYVDTVDGVKGHPKFIGNTHLLKENSMDRISAGMYLINAETKDVYSRQIMFHALDMSTNDAMRSQASDSFVHDEGDKVEDKCVINPVLSDAFNGHVPQRFLENRNVQFNLCDNEAFVARDLVMDYGFNDINQVCRLMGDNDEEVFTNRLAYVSRSNDVRDDEKSLFHISIPVDSEMVDAMAVSSKAPDEIYDAYKGVGVTMEESKASYMNYLIDRDGSFTSSLLGEPELDRALINGVPFVEFKERLSRGMSNDNLIPLSTQESMSQWLNDAVRISSVEETVDMKEQKFMLRYLYVRNGVTVEKVESKRLTDEQMCAYLARPRFTDVELKDLVMQLHPENFATYAGSDGKGIYTDPVVSSINMTGPDVNISVEQKKEVSRGVRKGGNEEENSYSSPKISRF